MNRLQQLALVGMVFGGMTAMLDAMPIICLQYSIGDDGGSPPTTFLYYGDKFPDDPDPCAQEPTPGDKWFVSTAVPQDCPNCCNANYRYCKIGCDPTATDGKPPVPTPEQSQNEPAAQPAQESAPRQQSPKEAVQQEQSKKVGARAQVEVKDKHIKKIKKDHKFTDTMKEAVGAPNGHVWHPRNGITEKQVKWVTMTTAGGNPIPLKLYVVEMNFKKAGLDEETLAKIKSPRTDRIGYESEYLDPEIELDGRFRYDDAAVKQYGADKKVFLLTLTPGGKPFMVFTETEVFP